MGDKEKAEASMSIIVAAMLDAAIERKLSQLKMTILPPGHTKPVVVRVIVVPEQMSHEFPQGLEPR